jgi:hypothetical protein
VQEEGDGHEDGKEQQLDLIGILIGVGEIRL